MQDYITPFIYLLEEMAPYLLLGFLIAGILHAFVPQAVYKKWLSGNDLKSVLLSIAFGVPLPLCSCGVIPTAVSMRKEGASKGATTAFLISTPQTGIDSIAATWSVLGLPFAILRPVVAMVTGLVGGLAVGASSRNEKEDETNEIEGVECDCDCHSRKPQGFVEKCVEALKYGFVDMMQDIGKWLVIGLILAGLITIFVPDDFFVTYASSKVMNYLVVLAIAIPMYVCATGSIPVAAALMLKGLSPGAALVFLMAGPATNMASIMILGKSLGRKPLIIYLTTIILGAITFGLCVDFFLPNEWFTTEVNTAFHSSCCHEATEPTPWWQIGSTLLLVFFLIQAFVLKYNKSKITSKMNTYKIKGMMCNHCKAHVEKSISSLDGVESVTVDLASGIANVEGTVSPDAVIKAVTDAGYDCEKA